MNIEPKHISVCVCSFQRPALLARLLGELERQRTDARFTYSIVVADNDRQQSARPVVAGFAAKSSIETTYCFEPRQNIALARNRALEHAKGDFVAFIDDDEFPEPDWLLMMVKACERFQTAGVLGPVRPHFDQPPPRWIIAGRFCERPEYPTGRIMAWSECRTGNLLFRRTILQGFSQPFNSEFENGGEDMDFFHRMTARGFVFIWCNEAIAFETVPSARLKRTFMLKRALLRGKNILKHSTGRWRLVALSVGAVPIYLLILPFTILLGHHYLMKYSIKLCDHTGRLLALVGLNPIDERPP